MSRKIRRCLHTGYSPSQVIQRVSARDDVGVRQALWAARTPAPSGSVIRANLG